MSIRRTVAGLCAVFAGTAAGAVVTAAPALPAASTLAAAPAFAAAPGLAAAPAPGYLVSLRDMPGSYRAGGPPGTVSVAVSAKRKARCVRVRRALTIRLGGLSADRIRVERATAGTWRAVPVTATADGVRVTDSGPDPTPLCRGRTATARYRVTFLAGVRGGQATFIAEAFSTRGSSLGRDTATRRVVGAPVTSPSPTPRPTPSPTPEPTAEATGVPAGQRPGTAPTASTDTGGLGGLGAVVIGLGLLMVAIGAALLVVLLRRNRKAESDGGAGGMAPTMLLPTLRRRHGR